MNLNQITVPATDVKESISFYQKLGLQLIVHTHDAYARFECNNGTTLSLELVQEKTTQATKIYFEVADVAKSCKNLEQQGIEILEPATQKPWLWEEALIQDPYENKVIIYNAGENRLNPPWKITS